MKKTDIEQQEKKKVLRLFVPGIILISIIIIMSLIVIFKQIVK